jgi:hypothetical protein
MHDRRLKLENIQVFRQVGARRKKPKNCRLVINLKYPFSILPLFVGFLRIDTQSGRVKAAFGFYITL